MASGGGDDLPWSRIGNLNLDDNEQQYVVEEPDDNNFLKTVAIDTKETNEIESHVQKVEAMLCSSENVFRAVYDVLKFLPNSRADYWQKEVVPDLVRCLKQHVEAKRLFFDVFGLMQNLKNTLSDAAKYIQQAKGNREVIEVVQETVQSRLNELENCIRKATNLSVDSFNTFGRKIPEIGKMLIGYEVVDFYNQQLKLSEKLAKESEKKFKICEELAKLQAEVNHYQCLIDAYKSLAGKEESEIDEIKRESRRLKELNMEINREIQKIPEKTDKYEKSFLGFTYLSIKTRWTDRECNEKKNYYENVIRARQSMIKNSDESKEAKEKKLEQMHNYIIDCEKKRKIALDLLRHTKDDYDRSMKSKDEDIENLLDQKREISRTEQELYNKVNLRGEVLTKALVSIHNFSQTTTRETTIFEPMKTLLGNIKSFVEIDFKLLLKDNPAIVFTAANNISEKVKMLQGYNNSFGPLLQQLNETKSLNKAIEFKE